MRAITQRETSPPLEQQIMAQRETLPPFERQIIQISPLPRVPTHKEVIIINRINKTEKEIQDFREQYGRLQDTLTYIDRIFQPNIPIEVVDLLDVYVKMKVKLQHHHNDLKIAQEGHISSEERRR